MLFISKENLRIVEDDGAHGAPDLIIEILSPTTTRLDVGSKKRVYARCGVLEMWAVDPQARKVVVYDLRKSETEPAYTWSESDEFECKLLPGLKFKVAKFFIR